MPKDLIIDITPEPVYPEGCRNHDKYPCPLCRQTTNCNGLSGFFGRNVYMFEIRCSACELKFLYTSLIPDMHQSQMGFERHFLEQKVRSKILSISFKKDQKLIRIHDGNKEEVKLLPEPLRKGVEDAS